MSADRAKDVSSYLAYLPALFQETGPDGASVLGRFLLAFEDILTGRPGVQAIGSKEVFGLEEVLDGRLSKTAPFKPDAATGVQRYFSPGPRATPEGAADDRAPDEFLDWLAGWVALTFQTGWKPEEKRRLIARIVPLYAKRGTLAGLEDLLGTYTGMGVKVFEYLRPFQVGGPAARPEDQTAVVGGNFPLGEAPPHYFAVRIVLSGVTPEQLAAKQQLARSIIDQEKPAHTWYDFIPVFPKTIQVGVVSRVGEDTLIGRPE